MHTQSVSPQKGASRWDRYLFAALTALEFLMSFTFLGYIHIEPISITIAYLPILIAGCFLGVGASTAMGFFFGLSSLYKATAYYVMPLDKVFSPFLSGSPLGSLVLSIGMRALFGFLIGALFAAGKRTRHPRVCLGLISLFAPKLHSLLVYAAMGSAVPRTGGGASPPPSASASATYCWRCSARWSSSFCGSCCGAGKCRVSAPFWSVPAAASGRDGDSTAPGRSCCWAYSARRSLRRSILPSA